MGAVYRPTERATVDGTDRRRGQTRPPCCDASQLGDGVVTAASEHIVNCQSVKVLVRLSRSLSFSHTHTRRQTHKKREHSLTAGGAVDCSGHCSAIFLDVTAVPHIITEQICFARACARTPRVALRRARDRMCSRVQRHIFHLVLRRMGSNRARLRGWVCVCVCHPLGTFNKYARDLDCMLSSAKRTRLSKSVQARGVRMLRALRVI